MFLNAGACRLVHAGAGELMQTLRLPADGHLVLGHDFIVVIRYGP